jgi:hypothetical protein
MRETGLLVEYHIDGEVCELPVGVELSAYRIVQEGLTNALKHAGGVPRRSPSGTPAVPWRLRSPPPETAGPLRPLRRPRLSLTRPLGGVDQLPSVITRRQQASAK